MASINQPDVGIKPLIANGYQRNSADNCKSKKKDDGFISFVISAVYVDDIIPVSNDVNMLKVENEPLCEEFEMVDQGEIHFILGISIRRNWMVRTLFISQEKYFESLLNQFGMEGCKPLSTPLDPGMKFHKQSDEEEQCDQSI